MPLLDQSQAYGMGLPHFSFIYDSLHLAWDNYHRGTPRELLVVYSQRTRASAVHDLILDEIEHYAESNKSKGDLRTFKRRMMRGMVIGNLMAVRIKKLDEKGLSRSQVTQQVRQFRGQMPLVGLGTIHNLELGYVLNKTETDIAEIRLVYPADDGIYWSMPIERHGAVFCDVDIFTPSTSPAPQPPKITPKRDAVVIPIRKEQT